MGKVLSYEFDKLSEAARILYLYGCLSNDDFDSDDIWSKLNNSVIVSSALFRKRCSPLDAVLFDLIKTRRNKSSKSDKGKKYKSISPNRFFDDHTKLTYIYRLCSRKSFEKLITDYIIYLDNLSENKGLMYKDKKNKQELIEYFGDDINSDSLFCMKLDRAQLTEEELSQLHSALMFFNGKAPYSIPGYFACDRIQDYLRLSDKYDITDDADTVFEYNNMERMLTDNAVHTIFEAIRDKKAISFYYRKKELAELKNQKRKNTLGSNDKYYSERKKCIPLKIMHEYHYGRSYLIEWENESRHNNINDISFLRLDDLFEVRAEDVDSTNKLLGKKNMNEIYNLCDEVISKCWTSNSRKLSHVVVEFDMPSYMIKDKVPVGSVTSLNNDSSCRLEADLTNFKDIVPFLRVCGEKAHISKEESPELYDYVRSDIRKALEKYGAL